MVDMPFLTDQCFLAVGTFTVLVYQDFNQVPLGGEASILDALGLISLRNDGNLLGIIDPPFALMAIDPIGISSSPIGLIFSCGHRL